MRAEIKVENYGKANIITRLTRKFRTRSDDYEMMQIPLPLESSDEEQ